MNRRGFIALSCAALAAPAFAAEKTFYTPGMAEEAMAAGKVVFLDFWTDWCPTCASQDRTISELRDGDPGYDAAILFITVDWDEYAEGELSKSLRIPRRSTLVALKGNEELGRIVAGTSKDEIRALMDAARAAASV